MTRDLPPTWRAAIDEWAGWARAKGCASTTLATRRQHLGHLARTIGVRDPWAVTRGDLVSWAGSMDWARETRRCRRMTLRSFYAYAVEAGHVEASPALALPAVKPSVPNPRPCPDDVYAAAMLDATDRERLILRLAAEHGLRRAEIAQVHTRDLLADLTGWSLVVHGKGSRERTVPLLDDVAAELRALPAGYAFPGADHGHLSPRWVGKIITDLLPEGWTLHKMRHRAATRFHEASGGDVFQVQELLGHASPVTTRAYVKVRNDKLRATVKAAAA